MAKSPAVADDNVEAIGEGRMGRRPPLADRAAANTDGRSKDDFITWNFAQCVTLAGILLIIETTSEAEVDALIPFSDNLELSSLVVCSVSDNLLGGSESLWEVVAPAVDFKLILVPNESSSDAKTLFEDILVRLSRSEKKLKNKCTVFIIDIWKVDTSELKSPFLVY